MDLNLKDKVIIVTGGAKGIGEGIVKVLAGEGAIPVIIGRSEVDNKKVVAEVEAKGGKIFQVEAELTDPSASEKAVQEVLKKFGRIEGLVNNAGVNDGVGLGKGRLRKIYGITPSKCSPLLSDGPPCIACIKKIQRCHRKHRIKNC